MSRISCSNATATRLERRGFFRRRALAVGRACTFGFAQRHRIVAEHRDRARHGADLVAAAGAGDGDAEIAGGHLRHRRRHQPQRPGDEEPRHDERADQRRGGAEGEDDDGGAVDAGAVGRNLGLGVARARAENIDQPVHVKRHVVARRIELEIGDALGLIPFAALHRGLEVAGDAVGEFELAENAVDIVGRGGVVGQHVVERALGGAVVAFDLVGGFLGVVGIRGGVGLVGRDAEQFDRRLGFGEREPRRRDVARHHRVDAIEFAETVETEPVGGDRQHAQRGDQQHRLDRDRQTKNDTRRADVRHGGGCGGGWGDEVRCGKDRLAANGSRRLNGGVTLV